jgi:hypothetical protein
MELRLQLHHHLLHQKFVLIQEGDDWRREFNTLDEAMRVAATIVNGSVPVLDLDEVGNVVSESSVSTAAYRRADESALK